MGAYFGAGRQERREFRGVLVDLRRRRNASPNFGGLVLDVGIRLFPFPAQHQRELELLLGLLLYARVADERGIPRLGRFRGSKERDEQGRDDAATRG